MRVSKTFESVLELIESKEVYVSEHDYDGLAEDDILVSDIMAGAQEAMVIEDYSEYPKGPCVLVLQKDSQGKPIHVV